MPSCWEIAFHQELMAPVFRTREVSEQGLPIKSELDFCWEPTCHRIWKEREFQEKLEIYWESTCQLVWKESRFQTRGVLDVGVQ